MSAEEIREEIRQLKARYCRLLDTKDWSGFAALRLTRLHIDMHA